MARKLLFSLLLFSALLQRAQAQVPAANFSSSATSGCAPLSVQFTDQSTGSPTSWNWDFGAAGLANQQNPFIVFATPGTYTVTLIVRNANGTNGVTKTNYITVYPSPIARFTSDIVDQNNTACAPSFVRFTDQSSTTVGTIASWEWDFGDGSPKVTQQNPAHQYTTPGFYTVTLKVVSSTGCQAISSIGRYVRIVPGVIPDFSFNNPATCRGPFNVDFRNLSSGPGTMTYSWNFGNSSNSTLENPTATYTAGGSYNVTLNAMSEYGCSGSIQKQVDVSGTGTNFTGPDTICINSSATFINASTTQPESTTWDFGNGESATTTDGTSTYNTAGIFNVKMINVYTNCKDSFSRPLVVMDKPVVNFTAPVTTACKAPLTVNFQDASIGAVDWQWDFGDGQTGTGPNPAHTYSTNGQFDVKLTITTRQGCTNTITKPAFVQIITPTVSFSNAPAGGCIPYPFSPAANVVSLDPVTSYFWEYGDGFSATTAGPVGPIHSYLAAGSYTIKVTITTAGGCTVSSELVNGIRTGTPPASTFTMTPTESCASDPIQFTFTGSASADEWLWDFDNDSTSTDKNPTHLFIDSGYFNVTVTAFNNKCPTVSAPQTVHIKPPIARFSYTVACPNNLLVNFVNESKVNTAVYGPVEYIWDFGDGTVLPPSPTYGPASHTYATVGTYAAKLTVRSLNPGDCSHTYLQQITLVGEMADFTISPDATACKGELLTITAANSNAANITTYEWSVGGGAYTVGPREIFWRFATTGTYALSLRITDINGCENTKTVNNAVVVSGPTANFAPVEDGGCTNSTINFTDLSTVAGTIQTWTFDFGDGVVQNLTPGNFKHTYADTGSYVVKMTVKDNNGCEDTFTATDTVFITKPLAGFKGDFTTICPATDLPFTDTSSGKGLSWRWDFGDGNSSTDQSPIHRYTGTSGTYTVKLVIEDEVGCKDSAIKTDYIAVKKPVPAFTAKDTSSVCVLLETKFTSQASDFESFYWDFGDGTTSTLTNPNHFYNDYGSYEAKLYVIGYGGCIDSASSFINLYDPLVAGDISYGPLTACNSLTVDFSLTIPPSTRFSFFSGDSPANESQNTSFQHFYKQPGTYAPYLMLQDSTGCQAPVYGGQNIVVLGVAPYFNASKKEFCDAGTVSFEDFTYPPSEPLSSHIWDFGDGVTSTDKDPTHQYTSPGTYIVKNTATTVANNCTNTITDTIRVYGTPDPVIVSDTATCINQALDLQASLVVPDTAITWKWDLGSNGSSDKAVVSVKYPQTGTYAVGLEATNKLGCKNNTSKNIFVSPGPTITINGSLTIPVGSEAPLPVSYSSNAATYSWTPVRNLSCTDCPTPVANPKSTTTYTVRAADVYGCAVSQDITVTVICNKENYFVPNTFSPNNDGQNDVFMPRGRSIDRVNRMQIFNRWGELVFEKRNFMVNDASAGWNGTFKGKPAAADVYVYVIEFVCDNSAIVPFRGNVTLLR
ncbi:PKD domain-containing protein [Paraflavitalea sp. CAU 1676]|uniref:PKD domain-containing protein n=1 Tax=Paraflavitalea sp. CAU 1676 TaxID=3032598 RepID=UPI0023DBBCF8|nr:PKD domain-containing protein [Paraflavitalea sp. CAU 1676]MDF2187530.1 PKD domain-containing protein [Paraflavitalea sp. CAU 1676]